VRNVAEDFHTQVRPPVEQLLASGENLEGVYAATQQSTFRGGMVALAVTDRRLLDRLGGGDAQQAGIGALAAWVRRHHPGG
jgi:hypothetical protein